jgi:hypothetical protein
MSGARASIVRSLVVLAGVGALAALGFARSGVAELRPAEVAQTRFPVHVAPGGRHLVDANGKPFLMVGDAAWSLVAQLETKEVKTYLDDRRKRGFNTILFNLLEHKFADDPPRNAYGEPPFALRGDIATPNESYFRRVDAIVRGALDRGFLVLLFPLYAGLDGGSQGWWAEMKANGVDKLRAFGRYVGKRYGRFPNVVWVQGGDFSPPRHERHLVEAVAQGIRSVDDKLHTFHGGRGTSALAYWSPKPAWLGINTIYTNHDDVVRYARIEYRRSRVPFFLIEARYESTGAFTGHTVRQQAYQATLAGASGTIMGNRPIWSFAPEWRQALGSSGAVGTSHLGRLLKSLAWWKLVPDVGHRLLIGDLDTGAGEAVAARARDGSFALVYAPTARTLTLDLRGVRGKRVRARWFDPTTGRYRPAGTALRTSRRSFRTPRVNAAGDGDWALILTPTK